MKQLANSRHTVKVNYNRQSCRDFHTNKANKLRAAYSTLFYQRLKGISLPRWQLLSQLLLLVITTTKCSLEWNQELNTNEMKANWQTQWSLGNDNSYESTCSFYWRNYEWVDYPMRCLLIVYNIAPSEMVPNTNMIRYWNVDKWWNLALIARRLLSVYLFEIKMNGG